MFFQQMGIPLRTLICASNANNVLTEFFHSGTYSLQRRNLRNTSSPAIDILKSSNVERFLYHMSGEDHLLVHKCMNDLDTQKYFTVPKQVRMVDVPTWEYVGPKCADDRHSEDCIV